MLELTTDDAFDQPLVEDVLSPVPTPGLTRTLPEGVPAPAAGDLPLVSIGRPRAWPLEEVMGASPLPPEMQASLARERFLLVRLSCSFRPRQKKTSIAFARFVADLIPDAAAGGPAVAFDLYPRSVERTSTVSRRVAFAPTLTFKEVEAGVGELSSTIEYPAVEPIISASGLEEPRPSWDFSAARGNPLHGGKLLLAVVSAPRELRRLRVGLSITATLDHHGLRLPPRSAAGRRRTDRLSRRQCGRPDQRRRRSDQR